MQLRFEIYPRSDGRFEVVDRITGQVRACGSPSMALFIQATLLSEQQRKDAAAAKR